MHTNITCLVVVADFESPDAVNKIASAVSATECAMHLIAKGSGGCRPYLDRGYVSSSSPSTSSLLPQTCEKQANIGDDAATFTRFVWQQYDALPERLLFVPASEKWSRMKEFRSMLAQRHTPDTFRCISMNAGQLGEHRKWEMAHYRHRGQATEAAEPPRDWFCRGFVKNRL